MPERARAADTLADAVPIGRRPGAEVARMTIANLRTEMSRLRPHKPKDALIGRDGFTRDNSNGLIQIEGKMC